MKEETPSLVVLPSIVNWDWLSLLPANRKPPSSLDDVFGMRAR